MLYCVTARAQEMDLFLSKNKANLFNIYKELHATPELSFQEKQTSEKLALELQSYGFQVTTQIGKYGVVGVIKNGDGPTLMIRTDMDALPVEEKTGFKFASKIKAKNSSGDLVSVMHACGHDIHMTVFLGAAKFLAEQKKLWRGTLVMIGQPAEELGEGAQAMLEDGLFKKFPRPDMAIAFHTSSTLAAGRFAYHKGYTLANVDSLVIEVKGIGGHGAYPHRTKDPIVLASQMVVAFQTLVSREISPIDSGVVTVGVFNAGTKSNIIPDSATLKLTIRSYKDDVREKLLKGVERIAMAQAASFGLPKEKMPVIKSTENYTPAVYNDPELVEKMSNSISKAFSAEIISEAEPVMGGEDFSHYGRQSHKVPISMLWLGTASQKMIDEYKKKNQELPSLHSSTYAPDWEMAIPTGVKGMAASAISLLQ